VPTPTARFLSGDILPQLLRLAVPVLVVLAMQTGVGIAETWFVSRLGTAAIAGLALVFPLLMLMIMMSNGGFGGGVAAAVSRALGAGQRDDADALVRHSVVVAAGCGVLFTLIPWLAGPALYRSLGAQGQALENALLYSNLVFAASIPMWVASLLSAALRGAGNVRVPARVVVATSIGTLVMSPSLIFGFGRVPGLGVAGAGTAMIINNLAAALVLVAYLRSSRSPVRLARGRIEWRLLRDILGVGTLSAIGTVMANVTVAVTVGLVGHWGVAAIAGYGMAARLDYLLIPLVFALGTASVTMIGTNVGARQFERARRIAWVSVLLSAGLLEAIGLAAALAPEAWMHFFSHDPAVVETGVAYLVRVAPVYGFYGTGMALYFCSQGFGRMGWVLALGSSRLLTVLIGGWLCRVVLDAPLTALFWVAAVGLVLFSTLIAAGVLSGLAWRIAPPALPRVDTSLTPN
jgi:putative MATE family efflux protein